MVGLRLCSMVLQTLQVCSPNGPTHHRPLPQACLQAKKLHSLEAMNRKSTQACVLWLCRDRIAKSFAREKAAYDAAKSEEDGSISVAAAQQATSKAVSQEAGGSQEKAEGDQSFTRHELGQHNTGDARTGAQDQRKHAGAEAELATLGGSEEWGPRMRSAETADDGGSSEGVTGGGKNQDTQSGAADESRADVRRSKQGGTGQRERKARSADGAAATDAQQEGATGNKAVTEDDSEDWSR